MWKILVDTTSWFSFTQALTMEQWVDANLEREFGNSRIEIYFQRSNIINLVVEKCSTDGKEEVTPRPTQIAHQILNRVRD